MKGVKHLNAVKLMSIIPVHMVFPVTHLSWLQKCPYEQCIILWYVSLLEVILYHFSYSECVVLTYSIPETTIYDDTSRKVNMMFLAYEVAHTDNY